MKLCLSGSQERSNQNIRNCSWMRHLEARDIFKLLSWCQVYDGCHQAVSYKYWILFLMLSSHTDNTQNNICGSRIRDQELSHWDSGLQSQEYFFDTFILHIFCLQSYFAFHCLKILRIIACSCTVSCSDVRLLFVSDKELSRRVRYSDACLVTENQWVWWSNSLNLDSLHHDVLLHQQKAWICKMH